MRSSPLFMSPRVSFEIYELSATFSFLFTFLCSSLQLRRRRRFFARHHPPTHSALVHGYFHCGHRSNRAKKMIKGKKKKRGRFAFPFLFLIPSPLAVSSIFSLVKLLERNLRMLGGKF